MRAEAPAAPAEMRVHEGLRTWMLAAGVLVLIWLVFRAVWILELPAALGTDPYIRLYSRDTLLVPFIGRNWMPLLQSLIWLVYAGGGAADAVQRVVVVAGLGFILSAAYYLYRAAGATAALLFALLLSVNEDVLWVSASPYQEALFYLLAFGALAELRGQTAGPCSPPALVRLLAWVWLAGLARYEGILLGAAIATALAAHWWRDRGLRRGAPYAGLALGLVAIPGLGLSWLAGLQTASGESAGLDAADSAIALAALGRHLAKPEMLVWLALGAAGLVGARAWRARLPPDALAALLYLAAFVAVYLVLTPYVPVQNSRFHIPIDVAVLAAAALGTPPLVASARARMPRGAAAVATFGALLLLGVHLAAVWSESSAITVHRARKRVVEPALGRFLDAQVAPEAGLLLAWPRGDFHRYPAETNLRIIAYLRGRADRVRFADDWIRIGPAERRELLREVGAVAFDPRYLADATVRDVLAHVHGLYGDAVRRKSARRNVWMLSWGASASGESIDIGALLARTGGERQRQR